MTALIPYDWPQDSLQIPPGLGVMTRVESANADITRREGKTFAANFDTTGPDYAALETRIINTDQDGDFWCQNIYVAMFHGGNNTAVQPIGRVQVTDLRTGNPLFFGSGVPITYLVANALQYDTNTVPPNGWRSTSTLVQAVCFTRHGGIKVEIAGLAATGGNPMFLQVAFAGWQEYAHASQ